MEASAGDEREGARELLAWFDAHKRDLPWRHSRDPYAIWLSEIMLQQTRVDTVVPYYQRFLQRFPDVRALAGAPLEEVLSAWSGLGYYRRARGLHAAAREVVARYGGRVPASFTELSTLPGFGSYTAGAVASIAFGEREVAVDGNVTRVMSRWLGLSGEEKPAQAQRAIRAACQALQDPARPGDFNQALMELGATVCTPARPRCEACPWQRTCRGAVGAGEAPAPRAPKARRALPLVKLVAALALDEATVVLARRPLDGLFGGLWEPPMVDAPLARAKQRLLAAGLEPYGRPAREPVVHVLTHRVLEVRSVRARPAQLGQLGPYEELRRVPRAALDDLPMSTLARRLLRVSFGDR